jgi:hypothetical protein
VTVMYGLCTTVVGRTRSSLSCGAMQFLECLQSIRCVRIRKTSGSTYELKIAHACLYGKTINGRVGIAAGDIRKPTSAGVLPQVLLFRGYCNCGLEGEIVYRS